MNSKDAKCKIISIFIYVKVLEQYLLDIALISNITYSFSFKGCMTKFWNISCIHQRIK